MQHFYHKMGEKYKEVCVLLWYTVNVSDRDAQRKIRAYRKR